MKASDPPVQRKVFATPFRLVFKNTETNAVTWIEVESLDGLKTVIERVGSGKLVPVNCVATLDRQLWGLLAEHVGFLRYAGPASDFSAGIQPAGAEVSQLADDMTTLFGGFDGALEGLSEMRNAVLKDVLPSEPVTVTSSEFVKDDGVNLTGAGEDFLAEQVYGHSGKADNRVKMNAANAEVLVAETELDPEESETESGEES
jgi:hypothetical protein